MSLPQTVYAAMPVPTQNVLVSTYGYYLRRKRHGPAAAPVRALVSAARSWSAEDVVRYQSAQLVRILTACAARVPYYRDLWRATGVTAAELTHVDHLQLLPVLAKEAVRRQGAAFQDSDLRPYWTNHTSGSTGTPVVVHVNQRTYHLTHALLEEHERSCGIEPSDLRATFAGRMVQPAEDIEPPFWRHNRSQRQLIFSAYHLSPRTLPHYVEELARRQPAELIGYPSAIASVAAHINASGRQGSVRPRVVVTNSETLFAWQRQAIEQAFGCPVRDYYGSAEALVFAPQCVAGAYHFNPLLGIAEIVDEHGRAVLPGQSGRLVCTTLTNDVMPLVRYEIGDAAVRLDGPCSCGSVFHGVREILGRQDDTVFTPDGRAIGRMDHIFKGVTGIRECQIVQDSIDRIRLDVVADDGFDGQQEHLLRENARVRLGGGMQVEISRVREIPRTLSGKFRGVVNNVTVGEHGSRSR